MNDFPSNPYGCTPKYINEQIDILLTWSLITASNIKYDNFITYNKQNGVLGGIRSRNILGSPKTEANFLFNANIDIIEVEGAPLNFKITKIIEDNIETGITEEMIFTYKEKYSPNPDTWTYTWYEVDGTSIKLIPNIDCPTKPTPDPTPDKSTTSNPKCSQILDSSGKRSDPTLISDRSSYNGVNNWSITSYDGKLYDGFTINFIFYSRYYGYLYRFYNNKYPNFEMYLSFIFIGEGQDYDPNDPVQPGDIIYNCKIIKDTMNLGIKEGDYLFFSADYNYYVPQRGISYLPNIKIFPTSCTQYIPGPLPPAPLPTTPSPITTYSKKKSIFFIFGILFLITGLILFYYINKKTKNKFIQNNKKLYSSLIIFFIILGIIFIILYLTSKINQVQNSTLCIKKCETNCGQDDGCGKKCDPTYIIDYSLLGNNNWSLITSSGFEYSKYFTVLYDEKNLIQFISDDVPNINVSKFVANINLIDGTKNFKINNIVDLLNTGIKENDEFTFDSTTNYYSCGNIKIFPSMCMIKPKK